MWSCIFWLRSWCKTKARRRPVHCVQHGLLNQRRLLLAVSPWTREVWKRHFLQELQYRWLENPEACPSGPGSACGIKPDWMFPQHCCFELRVKRLPEQWGGLALRLFIRLVDRFWIWAYWTVHPAHQQQCLFQTTDFRGFMKWHPWKGYVDSPYQ